MQRALGLLTVFFFLLVPTLASAQNTPPVADAGPDQQAFVDEIVLLSGSATDPDGDFITSWLWTVDSQPTGSAPFLSANDRPNPFFQAFEPGDYVLSLVVSDGLADSAPDSVLITVAEILPPVAIAAADVTSGTAPLTVSFDGSASQDLVGGGLTVDCKKLDLSSLDNANGVDVELQIGSAVAVENLTMQPHGANQLYYDAAAP